jgi:inorganic pyrophosphatase
MEEIPKARDSPGPPQPLTCVVEIPKGSRNKYEYDPELSAIRLDRFVSASVVYPTDYGFIPETLSLDGDALDVLVCVSEPTFPGCVVLARPIALLEMEDEHGIDPHVLSVPIADPGWNQLERFEDLPTQLVAEIGHFFAVYKDLDDNRRPSAAGATTRQRRSRSRSHAAATRNTTEEDRPH